MSFSTATWLVFSGCALLFFARELTWWARRTWLAWKSSDPLAGRALLMLIAFFFLTLNLAVFFATGIVAAVLPEPPAVSEYEFRAHLLRFLLVAGEGFVLLAGATLALFRARDGGKNG